MTGWDALSWEAKRGVVLTEGGHRCAYCGGAATEVDHIWPRVEGGGDERENLQALCRTCNARKGTRAVSMRTTLAELKRGVEYASALRDSLSNELDFFDTVIEDMREHAHPTVAVALACLGVEAQA